MSRPIRRAQLIAPFGVGAMFTAADGSSLICAGLDYWFSPDMDPHETLDEDEFIINEWRLERALGVEHFRLPPDHRERRGSNSTNTGLTVPFFRFPTWAVCPRKTCRRLQQIGQTDRGPQRCRFCEAEGHRSILVQVPFVAMCENGHLQEFPWREWVHRSVAPTCTKPMRLRSTGGTSLAGQRVECECGVAPRSLAGITGAKEDKTVLSSTLDSTGVEYLCAGAKPWLGQDVRENCGLQIQGSLRNASNVHFADVRSAIYLPPIEAGATSELIGIFSRPPIASRVAALLQASGGPNEQLTASMLMLLEMNGVSGHSSEEVEAALHAKWSELKGQALQSTVGGGSDDEIRRGEFGLLRAEVKNTDLAVIRVPSSDFDGEFAGLLDGVSLVTRLKETRVFAGFGRVRPTSEPDDEKRKALLWNRLPRRGTGWLPAYTVFGEGVFLELSANRLAEWETRGSVIERCAELKSAVSSGRLGAVVAEQFTSPRYLLLHTFAHVVMNGLTFECGYSTAALRERLYVSSEPGQEMSAILIYTASGDAEGTLGGLVRMGEPGQLEPLLDRVLDQAKWCSADPVCMEAGPQGPDSCNLAACHNCALVPETACEAMNRFLDRALLVGKIDDPSVGFFA